MQIYYTVANDTANYLISLIVLFYLHLLAARHQKHQPLSTVLEDNLKSRYMYWYLVFLLDLFSLFLSFWGF